MNSVPIPGGDTVESRDLFHCIAGLYAASLPDMELEAIYSTLMKPAQTIVAIATKQGGPIYYIAA